MTRPDSPVPAARREPSRPPLVAIVTVSGVIAVAVAIVTVPVGTVSGVVVIGTVAIAGVVIIARLEGQGIPPSPGAVQCGGQACRQAWLGPG